MGIYINNKSQLEYFILSEEIINATNSCPEHEKFMVFYKDSRGNYFVREREEFYKKFTKKL